MTGEHQTSPAVRRSIGVLDRFLLGRCIATVTRNRRPLAVTVLGMDVTTWRPLRLELLLAGGQRSHELAVEAGVVSINLLAEQDHALARRYGGVGVGAGWDELLGVAVRYRRSAPAVLECATTWLDLSVRPGPHGGLDWLAGDVIAAGTHLDDLDEDADELTEPAEQPSACAAGRVA